MTEATPPAYRLAAAHTGLGMALLLLAACSHMQGLKPSNWHAHWPWHRAPPPAAPAVTELVADSAGSSGTPAPILPQTWDRNTLRVALNNIAGEGELVLRPVPGHGWPIRLEFAVLPGTFGHLDVRGEQRVILTVPDSGGETVLGVPPGLYSSTTKALTLHYGP